jgi:hypothetical protein
MHWCTKIERDANLSAAMPKEVCMALDVQEAGETRQLPTVAQTNLAYRMHPAVYLAVGALALLFIASAWAFAAPNDVAYLLAIVTGFILAAIGLPFQLWRVRRHGHDPRDSSLSPRTLTNWLHADFDVWQTRIPGKDAAAAILLPIAAVAIGLFCLAIVLHVDVG